MSRFESSTLHPTIRRLAAFGIVAIAASPLAGQQPGSVETVSITGAVVAEGSETAVPGAAVLLSDRADPVVADRNGRFVLREVRPGQHSVIVTQLGYDTLWTRLDIRADPRPISLRLTPDPIVLERVTAMVDRLAHRRNSIGTSVRVIDPIELQRSTALSIREHIERRTILRPTRCPDSRSISPCALVRGRATQVAVILDGARVIGGLDVLSAYPPEEIYTAEVIGGGRTIRVYTNWFMEAVAQGRRIPDNYLF